VYHTLVSSAEIRLFNTGVNGFQFAPTHREDVGIAGRRAGSHPVEAPFIFDGLKTA
jgi:hypothetical protein